MLEALFGSPKLLVLDEPNSNLDKSGEDALGLALEVAKERKVTTIVISHRPNILSYADKILILQDGVVVNFGKRMTFLKR